MNDHLKPQPILLFLLFILGLQFSMLAFGQSARSAEIYVSPDGSDDAAGTISNPLLTIDQGLGSAGPGDTVFLREGTYHEKIVFPTSGTENERIVLSAYENETVLIQQTGRVMDVDKPYITISGLTLDGGWGKSDIVVVKGTADFTIIRDLEIRNGRKDGIDIWNPEGVLIDNCLIHDTIWFEGDDRYDAHGIVTEGVKNLTIRNTEIYYVSGDALQFQYGGWDDIRVENCTLWNGPLPTARGGADAGVNPGENAIDTKYVKDDGRGRLYVENTVAYGWRSDIISNAAAFNIKHNVETVFDGVIVYDNYIAFRLRGGTGYRGGAWVTIKNAVVFDSDKAVRYEDDIENLHIYNMTFGNGIGRFFESAGGHGDGFQVLNCLFLASEVPNQAADASNLAVGADSFKNVSANDYHLEPDSSAIDAGVLISEVTVDQDGDPRPIGQSYDVGADEYDNSQSMVIISGYALDTTGDPLSDVAIRSENNTVATTDAAGQYSISVESGWNGTLTPLKAGYLFVPTNRSFSNVVSTATDQDFAGEIIVYQISGHVVDPDGQSMAGAVIRSSDGDQVATDDQGIYSISAPHGWNGILTPEKTGFTFTPENRSYQNVEAPITDQDYSAVAGRFTLSGQVQDASGNGLSEVEIRVNNNALASTDNAGDFSFEVPLGWSGQLIPFKAGYVFTPATRSYENIASDQPNIAFEGRKEIRVISGQIQDADGTGIPEAEIFSDGQLLGISDAEGAYLLELEAGWSGTLTPQKEGFDFEPPSRTINNLTTNETDQNFIGKLKNYTISGRILYPDGNPIPETTVSVEGASAIVTDSVGRFSILVKYGWAGTVTPEKEGFTFTPLNRSYSDVSNDFVDQKFTGTPRLISLGQAIAVLKIVSGIPVTGMDMANMEWVEDGRVDLKDALYILRNVSY